MTISTTKTVGEIAAEMPNATREFEKLGIDYCCGGSRTLGDVCAEANISVEEVLAQLEKNAKVATPSEVNDWKSQPIADLITHITTPHHAFVQQECPRLEALAAKVAGVHGKNHPEILSVQEVFSALAEELRVHLMKEEMVLFPFIVRMEEAVIQNEPVLPSSFGSVQNPVSMMEHEHDSAGNALRAMRQASCGYTAPGDACISFQTLYKALADFEADLHQHIHLENNILFPRAIAMEKTGCRQ